MRIPTGYDLVVSTTYLDSKVKPVLPSPWQFKFRNSKTPVLSSQVFCFFSLIFFENFKYGFSLLDDVCEQCDSLGLRLFNKSFTDAFENSFNPSHVGTISLHDLRPGLCEATFLISNGKVSAHLESAGLGENVRGGKRNSVYLRHKEFFIVLLKVLKTSERILMYKCQTYFSTLKHMIIQLASIHPLK